MALVHNGFSSYRPSAAYVTAARLIAGLTEVARRLSERCSLSLTSDLRDSEYRSGWGRQCPGSVFDARYKGLTAHAARLDAAICRQEHLR
jgi:hypothetical protein